MMEQSSLVKVNAEQCVRIAGLLRAIQVPPADEDTPLAGLCVDELPNFYLAVVAVCHQTSPIGGPRLEGITSAGHHLFGWDFLRARWAERVAEDRSWNDPQRWAQIEDRDIAWIMSDREGNSTITDAQGRARLLRDLGAAMIQMGWASATAIYTASGQKLLSEAMPGLFELLARFRAYADPIRKKSCFFLELMRGQCGWRYLDTINLGAPVDYHEVRGHLRLGTVALIDPAMEGRIASGRELTAAEDEAIRGAVYEAIQRIAAAHGGADPATLHYFFWNVFRQCCGRVSTHCSRCGPDCLLPERYSKAISTVALDRCFFSAICPSAQADRKLKEHVHRTDYY